MVVAGGQNAICVVPVTGFVWRESGRHAGESCDSYTDTYDQRDNHHGRADPVLVLTRIVPATSIDRDFRLTLRFPVIAGPMVLALDADGGFDLRAEESAADADEAVWSLGDKETLAAVAGAPCELERP